MGSLDGSHLPGLSYGHRGHGIAFLALFFRIYRAGGRPEPDEIAHPLVPSSTRRQRSQAGWIEQETRAVIELDSAETGVRREVLIGKAAVGRGRPIIIAGPCAVEPGYVAQATELAGAGVDALRACVYKPRTHPDSFQGLGRDAAPLLDEARQVTGLPLVSEVLSAEDAEALGR